MRHQAAVTVLPPDWRLLQGVPDLRRLRPRPGINASKIFTTSGKYLNVSDAQRDISHRHPHGEESDVMAVRHHERECPHDPREPHS